VVSASLASCFAVPWGPLVLKGTADRRSSQQPRAGTGTARSSRTDDRGVARWSSRFQSMPTVYVGSGAVGSALGMLLLLRYGAALGVLVRQVPALTRRAGVLGLAWGVLLSGFVAFIVLLRHRSSWQQREHRLVQNLKRAEDQAMEGLLRALGPQLQRLEAPTSAQVLELATRLMGARQRIDVASPSLTATLTAKEGNAMPDTPQASNSDHRPPAADNRDESDSAGRW
jgi:hypothetical protein